MTDAVRRQIEAAQTAPLQQQKARADTDVAEQGYEARSAARSAVKTGLFGSHEVEEFPGSRFVATGATDACIQELTAVCRKHGMRCASTAHFMKRSESHAKASK